MAPRKKKAPTKRSPRKKTNKRGPFVLNTDFIQKTHDLSLYAQSFNLILILFLCLFNVKIREYRQEAVESRYLAMEMRESTDTLTENARAFCILGADEYMIRFNDELKRRTGYMDRVKTRGFTGEEIKHLLSAYEESEALAKIERVAFDAVQQQDDHAGEKACLSLFDHEYRAHKTKILNHINAFTAAVEKRVGGRIDLFLKIAWINIILMFIIEIWSLNAIIRSTHPTLRDK